MNLGNLAALCGGMTILFIALCVFTALTRYEKLTERLERKPTTAESDKVLDPILYFGVLTVVWFWGCFVVIAALGTQFGVLRQ